MPVSELDVLKPKDSSIRNWDDWPTYVLRKTNIISQKTGEPTSLLKAHKDHAVNITGYLETIDSDHSHFIRDQKYKKKPIELRDVVTYAFAEYHDGSYGFWAAGKAGWFEIRDPISACQSSYDMMKEAASMFYLMADKLRRTRRDSKKEVRYYARWMFRQYLSYAKKHSLRVDENEGVEAFHRHCDFFITSMLEGQEGLDWLNSPMYFYFKQEFPERFAKIQARLYPELTKKTPQQSQSKQVAKEKAATERGIKRKRDLQMHDETAAKPERKPDQDIVTSVELNDTKDHPKTTLQKRKSILQPSGSKFSKKAAGRRRSLPPIEVVVIEQDMEVECVDKAPTEKANSPLQSIDQKQMNLEAPDPQKPPEKKPTKFPGLLPRKYVGAKLATYALPTCRAQGPGDIWTCPFDTCGHQVREASTADGNASIKEHFQVHAREAQEKIDLVLSESRPYLPVDNLVRRLQSFVPRPEMFPTSTAVDRPIAIRSLY